MSQESLDLARANVDQAPDAPDVAAFVAAAFAPDLDRAPEREHDARFELTSAFEEDPERELARGELDAGSPHTATAPSETLHEIEWTSPSGEETNGAAEQVTEAPSGMPGQVEPWALPLSEPAEVNPQEAMAAALERVAHRIRAGEIVLAPDGPPTSDEAALAAALAALLRVSRG
jgi:hypothetical protein